MVGIDCCIDGDGFYEVWICMFLISGVRDGPLVMQGFEVMKNRKTR